MELQLMYFSPVSSTSSLLGPNTFPNIFAPKILSICYFFRMGSHIPCSQKQQVILIMALYMFEPFLVRRNLFHGLAKLHLFYCQ